MLFLQLLKMIFSVIKKIASIVFLFLASSIFLAHDIIPHHHHDDHVCSKHVSCTHDSEQEKQGFPADAGEECCLLADATLIITGSHKNQINCTCCFNERRTEYNYISHFTLFKPEEIPILTPFPFEQNPFPLYYQLNYISQSLGLRAPPLA